MGFLEMFDELASAEGSEISVLWRYRPEDDSSHEYSEEFAEDVEHLEFDLVETSS